jgi:hypothetical protein
MIYNKSVAPGGWLDDHRRCLLVYVRLSDFPCGAGKNPQESRSPRKYAAGKTLCLIGLDLLLMAAARAIAGAFSVDGLAVAGADNMPMAQAKNLAERTADTPRPLDLHQVEWTLKFV